jgi:hypothetical protein
MTKQEYFNRFGVKPEQVDLNRINCKVVGTYMHEFCGVCPEHDKPRFICHCKYTQTNKTTYLGDDIYVYIERNQIRLCTNSGEENPYVFYLPFKVYQELVHFVTEQLKAP